MTNFQRKDSKSNAHVGLEFEETAADFFRTQGLILYNGHAIDVGIERHKKAHKFDLGSDNPKVIIECKSHTWTSGNNVPSAKITVWNEAMYYFSISPSEYRKIFFVLQDIRSSTQETLAEYYIRLFKHMIPNDVDIWEYSPSKRDAVLLNKTPNNTSNFIGCK